MSHGRYSIRPLSLQLVLLLLLSMVLYTKVIKFYMIYIISNLCIIYSDFRDVFTVYKYIQKSYLGHGLVRVSRTV